MKRIILAALAAITLGIASPAPVLADPYVDTDAYVGTPPPTATMPPDVPREVSTPDEGNETPAGLPITGGDIIGLIGLAFSVIALGGALAGASYAWRNR